MFIINEQLICWFCKRWGVGVLLRLNGVETRAAMCCVYVCQIQENELVSGGRNKLAYSSNFSAFPPHQTVGWLAVRCVGSSDFMLSWISLSVHSWPKWTWPTGCWAERVSRWALQYSMLLLQPEVWWKLCIREQSNVAALGESSRRVA